MSGTSAPQAPADPQASILRALLQVSQEAGRDGAPADISVPSGSRVEYRKVWVKRPGGSATLIPVRSDALVDDLRDLILRKYANSIGRHFDSPDLYLHITPRDKRPARPLGPEEVLAETLDSVYPGGQTVEEALVILVPQPHSRPSPRPAAFHSYQPELGLPSESAEGYFPPVGPASSTVPHSVNVGNDPASHVPPVMPQGQAPSAPSPGSSRAQAFADRPRLGRSHTPSPAVQGKPAPVPNSNGMSLAPRVSPMSHCTNNVPLRIEPHPPVPAPTSHPLNTAAADATPSTQVSTPPARQSSPRPSKKKARKPEKQLPPVPPINVLLVEDNPINLKLLEAFAKGLKVRWQSAMNGQDAVTKWRSGGFHLVLMDIQLPVMNGLEATREIRRLERENSIGVFTSSTGKAAGEEGEMKEEDRLTNIELFKSPVIIVALTASSLQSDRHEALAAGCNDFLTKVSRA